MPKPTHRTRRAHASAIAIATVLAMLVAPICGSSCAGLYGCGATAGIVASGAEDCHHAASSTSETWHLHSTKACGQHDLPAAIVIAFENPSSLNEIPFTLPLHAAQLVVPAASNVYRHRTRWRGAGDPPQAALLEITATILQI